MNFAATASVGFGCAITRRRPKLRAPRLVGHTIRATASSSPCQGGVEGVVVVQQDDSGGESSDEDHQPVAPDISTFPPPSSWVRGISAFKE